MGETEEEEVGVEIGVGTKGVKRGILPCLKCVRMKEIVGGLPVVEGFVAVGDWGDKGGEETKGKEKEERDEERGMGAGKVGRVS